MVEDRVLADSIDTCLFQGLTLEANTITSPEYFGVGNALQIGVDKQSSVVPNGEG